MNRQSGWGIGEVCMCACACTCEIVCMRVQTHAFLHDCVSPHVVTWHAQCMRLRTLQTHMCVGSPLNLEGGFSGFPSFTLTTTRSSTILHRYTAQENTRLCQAATHTSTQHSVQITTSYLSTPNIITASLKVSNISYELNFAGL